jgi:uncharacterized protein YoxC
MATTLLTPALLQSPAVTRDGLAVAADISMVVVGVAILVLAVVLVFLLLKVNRTLDSVRTGVSQNLGPVSDRARTISDNVEFITQALRTDVERLNASVRGLTDGLQLASERMEDRIEEFNVLMEVVQGEAEDIFLDTAATVRGVREGALAITRPDASSVDKTAEAVPSPEEAPLDDAEIDDAEPQATAVGDVTD